MDGSHGVSDSSDWLSTSIPLLSPLENALRCQVCKDFFNNPVITSCAHTFCSICIRRCLSAEGKCPACRTSDQASKLRRNWAVEEVVTSFQSARAQALGVASAEQERKADQEEKSSEPPRKRRRRSEEVMTTPSASQRQTRSRAKQQQGNGTDTHHNPEPDVVIVDDNEHDEDYADPAEDGLVSCPLCNARMKEIAVFSHLDRCDGTSPTSNKPRSTMNGSLPLGGLKLSERTSAAQSQQHSSTQQERLSELNYSLLTEAALRRKLKEQCIPNTGPKALLIRRHTEWVNLWNSNADSARPKGKRELLAELDGWERAQGGLARESHGTVNGIMKKEWDAEGYKRSQGSEFERLIREARAKRGHGGAGAAKEKKEIPSGDGQVDSNGMGPDADQRDSQDLRKEKQVSQHSTDGNGAEERESNGEDALPGRFAAAVNDPTTRKMPMFTVPSNSVTDVDMFTGPGG